MERQLLDQAIRLLEQANGLLAPHVRSVSDAEALLQCYARVEKLAAFGTATLSARIGDAPSLARATGSSVGQARRTIETGRRMAREPRLAEAVQRADVSLDQADEIARTVSVAPESVDELISVARAEPFHVLKERARAIRLEHEDRADLAERQHQARRLRHHVGELGMIHLEADLEPHVGVPIVNRLEREARRLARAHRTDGGADEPVERHLADALPAIVGGGDTAGGHAEVVILVSHEVAARGWSDVRDGERCSIPGVGPVSPAVARRIADDAFLTGVFYDGTDLRHLKRWTRGIPAAVRIALQLGSPPEFDGPRCVDCGNRFRLELDHQEPVAAGGETSLPNTKPRCEPCHAKKTAADRRAAKLRRRVAAQPP